MVARQTTHFTRIDDGLDLIEIVQANEKYNKKHQTDTYKMG